MSIKIASMNFGDCDTILHNTPNGMKNIAEVLGPNGEVYWSAIKELTGIPPLSIRSNGTMLLDYLISGNMEQNGAPTPTTPIQPQETGDRTGNLFDKRTVVTGERVIVNGVSSGEGKAHTGYIDVTGLDYISVSHSFADGTNIYFYSAETAGADSYVKGTTAEVPQTAKYCRINMNESDIDTFMLNTGSTALPYEPYGYKIPISSGGTTTPIYLGEAQTTRRIRKLVLTGDENWVQQSMNPYSIVNYSLSVSGRDTSTRYIVCTHYEMQTTTIADTTSIGIYNGSNIFIRETYLDINNFKNYLRQQYSNGTPVTVWYVLTEPTTGIVNEPIRKIGDYADTVSMEQAGVQIPTLHGNTVIDVETTLKPSQMYIKYK